jgi:D-amino-acid dehydrogenase
MRITIVGAGIIGLSTAYFLQKKGHEVMILEKSDGSDGASMGNAGMIVPSHFVPLAAPGMISQGIRWMFDSKSPFFIRPRFDFDLIKWGFHFWQSATQKHLDESRIPLIELSDLSKNLFKNWIKSEDFNCKFDEKGIILYFKKEKTRLEEIHLAEIGRSHGLDAVELSADECRALEPDHDLDVLGAVHWRCDAHLHPQSLINQLKNLLQKRGVEILYQTEMTSILKKNNRIEAVFSENRKFETDAVVLATGSWSTEIGKKFDLKIPVVAGKGYSITLEKPQKQLNFPAILAEARVAMTPMGDLLRIGGTMEIDSLNREKHISRIRVEGIVRGTKSFFPSLDFSMPENNQKIWHGLRPVSPDGLPYIGRAKNFDNLFVGTGHAMMGLGLGPATGLLLSQLIDNQEVMLDLKKFEVDRFS